MDRGHLQIITTRYLKTIHYVMPRFKYIGILLGLDDFYEGFVNALFLGHDETWMVQDPCPTCIQSFHPLV